MPMKRISMHLDIFLYWSMMIKENQITIWDQFKKFTVAQSNYHDGGNVRNRPMSACVFCEMFPFQNIFA
ncbi:hypothetical protein T02_13067 [Trichinella nativa]|uniref:Uncharacterized protein n=1 Tax=Trichinella nativa TaxID=6335 RepID=A0A0V1L8K4_9BILA|nr:hypothetical protein T02_13067 [Trichinella nativa]